jgi:hypothetical protein
MKAPHPRQQCLATNHESLPLGCDSAIELVGSFFQPIQLCRPWTSEAWKCHRTDTPLRAGVPTATAQLAYSHSLVAAKSNRIIAHPHTFHASARLSCLLFSQFVRLTNFLSFQHRPPCRNKPLHGSVSALILRELCGQKYPSARASLTWSLRTRCPYPTRQRSR